MSNVSAPSESDLLRAAMADHRAGRLAEAEAAYARLLQLNPRNGDAHHLSGVLLAQRGRYAEARACIERAVALQPEEAMFHNNLGNACLKLGQVEEAEACYRRAVELDPGRLDAANNLAVLLGGSNRPQEAERILLALMQVAPQFADARQNLASLYLRLGRVDDALQQCLKGVVVAPRSTELRRLLGMAYAMLGEPENAREVFQRWLDEEPDNPYPRHHLAALAGDAVPERASDAYVRGVFDHFADSFDAKLAQLGYRAPELVAGCVARLAGVPAKALRVLDAGCGTGLCGPLLAPWASRLEGVDLSPRMVEGARARQVYDDLRVAELVADLQAAPAAAFDLLVSADTLCYFGRLEAFAAAAARSLADGALLVFTVEAHPEEDGAPDYRLHHHGRYSHCRRYLEDCLRGAGFEPVEVQAVVPRREAGQPVQGWLVGARRIGPRD